MKRSNSNQDGFVALVSAIVISALLIIIAASLGYTGFFSRFNILDGEFKETSVGLAEACAEISRVEIANNTSFNPSNKVYAIGTGTPQPECTIVSVTPPGAHYTVQVKAEYNKSVSKITTELDRVSDNVNVFSWREIP
jgi:hypothetical protein